MPNDMRERLEHVVVKAKLKNICLGLVREITDHLIENDVVPVVRCKNCIHHKEDWCEILRAESPIADGFCCYGERTADNGEE